MLPGTSSDRQRTAIAPHLRLRCLSMSALMAPRVDALWQFRYRCRRRPHGLRRLAVDPDSATLGVEAGDGVPDTVFAEARWRNPAAHGVRSVGEVELKTRSGGGLVEWPLDLGAAPADERLVAVLSGFEIGLGDHPVAGVSELSVFTTIPGAEGRATAGVALSARRREPELEASLRLLVLSVPADRLEIHTPSISGVRQGGFEPGHPPLAATLGHQSLRPLGVAAFGIYLTAGHPERAARRRIRELGVSLNGLVLRWHCSTAATWTRSANVRATATVPCVALAP